MPWGQTFIPVWTGSGLERVFAFGEEQTTITHLHLSSCLPPAEPG